MEQTGIENKTRDFRLFLQQELLERCRKNARYSLRAFAKSLGVVPSALSDMLNGKRSITNTSIEKIGLALNLSLKQIQNFKTDRNSTRDSKDALAFQQITFDTFAIISDWYHYAILELIKVKSFKSDSTWISKRLGISKSESNAAIERLLRVGLIKEEKGKFIDISGGFSTNIIDSKLTSAGSKQLQKQMLEMSLRALESVRPELRNHTSMTMAINPTDLPEAIKRIKNFRRELCAYLERNQTVTEVYHLAMSLYPVSNPEEGKL